MPTLGTYVSELLDAFGLREGSRYFEYCSYAQSL